MKTNKHVVHFSVLPLLILNLCSHKEGFVYGKLQWPLSSCSRKNNTAVCIKSQRILIFELICFLFLKQVDK